MLRGDAHARFDARLAMQRVDDGKHLDRFWTGAED
jgi:hypothetical protein